MKIKNKIKKFPVSYILDIFLTSFNIPPSFSLISLSPFNLLFINNNNMVF